MTTETIGTIGGRCRTARTKAGLSQAALAFKAGVAEGVIGNIESGRSKSMRKLTAVANALNVNPAWLAEGRGTPEAEAQPAVELGHDLHLNEKEFNMVVGWLFLWRSADPVTRSLIESAFAVAHRMGEQQPAERRA